MTTTEDLVRDGLTGLAPKAPADAAAYAGIGRAITRRRRRRTAARVAAVAAVALVAVGAGTLAAGRNDTPGYSTQPGGTATDPNESGTVTFGSATFDIPAGWAVLWNTGTEMCVAPVETEGIEDCAGLRLARGELTGYEQGPYVDHGDWSWHTGTDVMRCPDRPYDPGGELDGVVAGEDGTAPVDTGREPVGDRTAVYDEWAAECAISGFTFNPRAWHLPESQMLIVDLVGRSETEAILASFEFSDGGADGQPDGG